MSPILTVTIDLLAFPNDLMILEDVFGKVQVKGVLEVHVRTAEEVLAVIERGAVEYPSFKKSSVNLPLSPLGHRRTEGTSKNATSSRSHAICRIRVKNLSRPEAEDGVLHLLDLAGSESSADTRWHNKERVLESVGINKSLAILKECIQKRAAVDDVGTSGVRQHIHVPYRSSKLTMLLKDAFEVASGRACRTVVIAMVNPSILDTPQSLSTLRYVAPLKMMKQGSKHMTDPNDPREWTNTELCARVSALHRSIDTNILCPYESGKQILRLSEAEFIERCTNSPGVTVKAAKDFYDKIWGLAIDARSKRNKKDC
ncbi:P-loop containing nucleoside triphosphate hydrolase protein [Rhizoclosmatium globosum]|uniref:p-loop containing nucleoside triphosphate hydrolase protein n=1 Tax=Rhizoclosmatium globosum TaxID=329046 RepID=A0A1Y2CBB5_9FUNG|nr:P-loop containing nucleoside triphosphate hydrolase protein [Rhizoclosmatium globosum]|eukprot:ORY44134.1 P-loop containing nucleoside triphosphate hydrolase protein [Rhizoclosmatium globosum]